MRRKGLCKKYGKLNFWSSGVRGTYEIPVTFQESEQESSWKQNFRDQRRNIDRRQEEKGMTEDKMIGWHHQLDGYEFEQDPGVGDGQGSLGCCSPWGHKQSDTTERLD